jgi:hypothetical protein
MGSTKGLANKQRRWLFLRRASRDHASMIATPLLLGAAAVVVTLVAGHSK